MQRGAVGEAMGGQPLVSDRTGFGGMTGIEGGGDLATEDGARGDKILMQRGDGGGHRATEAVALPSPAPLRDPTAKGGRGALDTGVRPSLPLGADPGGGTERSGEGPRRRALLGSTARNEPAADSLVARAERAGEWTVVMAIHAQLAGKDWRPVVAETRRRISEVAARRLGRCMLRVGSFVDLTRWDGFPGAAL
jgi:hypothetical protein